MTTTSQNGRLCNQIIRNIAVSLIAEKFNLKVNYCNKNLIESLGIMLFSGDNIYKKINKLNDNNYFNIYNSNKIDYNLNPNSNYFQTKEITNFIYNYLHTNKIKSNIINNNQFYERYNNNDCFIHIRLGDTINHNPGLEYYLKTLKLINFNNLYISSDTINHEIIKKIQELYPNTILIDNNEIYTIKFASTCKYIILSHGSFSAVISYLSFFSKIYYPEYSYNNKKIWYGDLFSIPNWNKIYFNTIELK